MSKQLVSETIEQDSLEAFKTQEWSRVSPLAIVYFFAKTTWGIGNSLVYMLPILALNFDEVKNNIEIAFFVVLAAFLAILISSVLNYFFYFYKFSDKAVEIKQGVFKKSHLDLPFNKIQNVKIVQPLYYRFKQYAYIELDTAGSAKQEAKIIAIPLLLADSFKQLIMQIKQGDVSSSVAASNDKEDNSTSDVDKEVLLNERSIKDLVIHGISNNRVWIILGALAPFYNSITDNLGGFLNSFGFDIAAYLDYQNQSIGLFIIHVLSIAMLLMLVMVSISVVGSIFVYYKYRLSKQGDRYVRRSGLLSKHEVSMRLSRIQIAVQQQDWLDVLIKRVNLQFEQNTSGYNSNAQAGNINCANKLMVPSVTLPESAALVQDAFEVQAFKSIPFKAISKRFILRMLITIVLPIGLVLFAVAYVNKFPLAAFGIIVGFIILLALMVYQRWRRWGYYFSENFVYIRKGLLGVNYYVFPVAKLQQVSFIQSIFMKRNNLASLRFVLASGAYKIPFMPSQTAKNQSNFALNFVAKYKPAWM